MKKIIFSLSMLALSFASKAQDGKLLQQVNLNTGKTFSSFSYKDTNGNEDQNLSYNIGNTYNLSYGISIGSINMIRPEIIFTEMGAKSSVLDFPVEWKLSYAGVGLGYLNKIINKEKFSLSWGLSIGYHYLLKGEQTIGTARYDLLKENALKKQDILAGILANTRFKIAENLFLSMEYRYNLGLTQIENQQNGETSKNIGQMVLVGLSFNL